MKPHLDRLIDQLSDCCLTEQTARRLVKLKPDRKLQAEVDRLSKKCTAGKLTSEEHSAFCRYVSIGTFVSTLKAKARIHLAKSRAK